MTEQVTDETLVSRFRETQNSHIFKLIVRRYKQRLYISAFKILNNRDEAEEIVQEAFIRVLRNLHKYKLHVPFCAWIFTINHNLCKDFLRAKQRKPIYENFSHTALSLHERENSNKDYRQRMDQIVDKLPSPAQLVEYAEQKEFIVQLVAQLPDAQKRVIILHDFEGLSYKQIASVTGTALGTVRSRIHYGREKLKAVWKKCAPNYCLQRKLCSKVQKK